MQEGGRWLLLPPPTSCSLQGLGPIRCTLLLALQASLRQVEARAEELKAAAQGHEGRAAEAAGELARANAALEKLGVSGRVARCGQLRTEAA